MDDFTKRLTRHMHWQFNLLGFGFILLSVMGAAAYYAKDYLWVMYADVIDIFSYGFVDNLYMIADKVIHSVVPFFLLSILLGTKNRRILSKPRIKFMTQVSLMFLGVAVYLLLSAATSGLISFLTSKSVGVAKIPESLLSNFLEVQWTYIIYMVVLSPIVEEYIYRGVVLECLRRYGNYFAIFVSAFLFALSYGRLQTALPGFFFGVFLALIALYYQSIRPVIWIRFAVAILSLLEMTIPITQLWIFGVICLVSYGVSVIFLFSNRYNRLVLKGEMDEWLSLKTFMTSFLMVIACAMMIALTYSLPLRQLIGEWVFKLVNLWI